jgi:hypothetical protein
MKRDMDLCRQILSTLEQIDGHTIQLERVVELLNKPSDVCYHHCHILSEAGLLHERSKEMTQRIPNIGYSAAAGQFDHSKASITVHAGIWIAYSLTWQGHEFLDQSRNGAHWEKAKSVANSAGTWSFSVIADILREIAVNAWKHQLS